MLHVFREIKAGVARSAKTAGVVTDRASQAFEREIAYRIGVQELANLLQGALEPVPLELSSARHSQDFRRDRLADHAAAEDE